MSLSDFAHVWKKGSDHLTFVLLHGTGGDEEDLVPLVDSLSPSSSYLGVRGNSREEGVNRFFRRLAEGVLDEEDLRSQTRALDSFIHAASAEYGFGLEHTIALGYSNGANIAASLLFLKPGTLAGAILLRPMAPFRQAPPILGPISPTLILAGQHDSIIPRASTVELQAQLRAGGEDVNVAWQAAGHELVKGDLVAAKGWLDARLSGGII